MSQTVAIEIPAELTEPLQLLASRTHQSFDEIVQKALEHWLAELDEVAVSENR